MAINILIQDDTGRDIIIGSYDDYFSAIIGLWNYISAAKERGFNVQSSEKLPGFYVSNNLAIDWVRIVDTVSEGSMP